MGAATVGNLFNDLCAGGGYTPERLTACKGDISALPSGDASVCNHADLSGVICGTGGRGGTIGSDSFAEICTDGGSATAIIDFNQDIERQKFCGDTRVEAGARVSECAGIYSGLCMGADLFDDDARARVNLIVRGMVLLTAIAWLFAGLTRTVLIRIVTKTTITARMPHGRDWQRFVGAIQPILGVALL